MPWQDQVVRLGKLKASYDNEFQMSFLIFWRKLSEAKTEHGVPLCLYG